MKITTKRGHIIEISEEQWEKIPPAERTQWLGEQISHYCYLCDKKNGAPILRGQIGKTSEIPGTRAYAEWVYALWGDTVEKIAREQSIIFYLVEKSGYRDVADRYLSGRMLSDGQLRAISRAYRFSDEEWESEIPAIVKNAPSVFETHYQQDLDFAKINPQEFLDSAGIKNISLNRAPQARIHAQRVEITQ